MTETASDVLVGRLIDWGVDTVFGLPGDGINGVMEALRKRRDKVRFIQVRHEEAAAFMACGYAKFTGRLGVCLATSGPGGIHLLNGLYDAKLDQAPVLAITGMAYHDLVHTYSQQDVELDKLFIDVAVYNSRVMDKSHVEPSLDLAIRAAMSYCGVAHITIPADIQDMQHADRSKRNLPHHSADILGRGAPAGDLRGLEEAATLLNAGHKVVILAGRGALGATDELEQVAELLGAPIVKALLGKAAVPDNSPYTTGGIGLLGTRPSQDAMEECDTLLMVGTSFPYIEFLPRPGRAKGVQIDIDPMRIGLRYPVEVGLIGDSRPTLRALMPLLRRNTHRTFLAKAQRGMQEWWKLMEERGTQDTLPMKPEVPAHHLDRCLRDDAIIAADTGTVTTWAARHIKMRRGQMFSVSGNLATMANGLPYAIAAQVAFPNRQCVAFVGDGGFDMLMAEFSTCVKYRLPVKVIIIKNNELGQIKWEQLVFLGNPEYGIDLEPIDHVKFAQACGGRGFRIDHPAHCGDILEQAMALPGPVIVEAVVDSNEPPMPPKIRPDQAVHFAEALVRGEPNREKIAMTVLSDTVRELI
jgi:pyruvate dehydrogenase (quinone)/pyruvate oxidase